MRPTDIEWEKFGKLVPVGTRFKWSFLDTVKYGSLLENYPHAERAMFSDASWMWCDALQGHYDEGFDGPVLARFEKFWIEAWDGWYCFDDIVAASDEDDWDESDPQMGPKFVGRS